MELIVIFSAFLVAALAGVCKRKAVIEGLSVAAALAAFAATVKVAWRVAHHGTYSPYSFLSVDALGALVMLIIACVGLAATVYSVAYFRRELASKAIGLTRFRQYYVLLALFLAEMFAAVAASSPVVTWIAVELITLSTAFLISFYNKPSALEAAWKYLIINSIGLSLALLGSMLFFTAQDGGAVTWQSLLAHANNLDPAIAKIAFILTLIGYGTKIGFVPMHTWLPDAHSKAPAPISALLSGVLLNVALVVVLRFGAITNVVVGDDFTRHLYLAFGLASLALASFAILTQKNYKRLLAYSSIENMGIIALGIGFGGIGVLAALAHMIYHSLVKSSLFFIAGNFMLRYGSASIDKVKGALRVLPVTSVLFVLAVFAATGFPPFGIFLTEFFTASAGLQSYAVVAVVMLVALAVAFLGFFRHTSDMVLSAKPAGIKTGEKSVWLVVPPLALLTLLLVLSFYMLPFMKTLIDQAVAVI